jgi:ketosteroid isomerase-like protein
MSVEERNLQVVAEVGKRWNSGDHEGLLDLYHDDIVMTAAPNWIDAGPWVGKEAVAANQRDWASAWDKIEMVMERVEAAGDKVVAIGEWYSRGMASGVGGNTPVVIVFTLQGGLVKKFDWLEDADDALRLAGID